MPLELARYRHFVVLTGAGISVASGLRTYRGPGGIWESANVERISNPQAFMLRPLEAWKHYGALRAPLQRALPNAAHLALARFEAALGPEQQFLLVTQNVDALHLQAGSRDVVEYHGNLRYTRCTNRRCDLEPYPDDDSHEGAVPHCPKCGAALRPDIVLFGEEIPERASLRTLRALSECDLFIAIGTSGLVYPAAGFVRAARCAGARTILVNLESMTPPDPSFQEEYLGRAEELVPQLFGFDR